MVAPDAEVETTDAETEKGTPLIEKMVFREVAEVPVDDTTGSDEDIKVEDVNGDGETTLELEDDSEMIETEDNTNTEDEDMAIDLGVDNVEETNDDVGRAIKLEEVVILGAATYRLR